MISSAISFMQPRSARKEGAVTTLPSTLHSSLRRISVIYSGERSTPRKRLIRSGLSVRVAGSVLVGYTSMTPSTTSPAPRSSTSSHARSSPPRQFSGSRPFSKREEDSVLMPFFFAVTRTEGPEKQALSNTTVAVLSVISLFAPPITPARAQAFLPSAMTSMLLSRI